MESQGIFFIIIGSIAAIIVWFLLIRWAVRANENIKNQQIIIWLLLAQWKRDGVPKEEIDKFRKQFDQDWLNYPEYESVEDVKKEQT